MFSPAARAITILFRWWRALSRTSVTGPASPLAAIARSDSHIVSAFTTVVLVTVISWRVAASHTPRTTLSGVEGEPLPARGGPHYTGAIDHRCPRPFDCAQGPQPGQEPQGLRRTEAQAGQLLDPVDRLGHRRRGPPGR
jgi:hypothetical protein